MPTKYELAQYLINLHSLMGAQDSTGIAKSDWMINEYKTNWDALKSATEKETTDETRNREQPSRRSETGTEFPRREPRSGQPDGMYDRNGKIS